MIFSLEIVSILDSRLRQPASPDRFAMAAGISELIKNYNVDGLNQNIILIKHPKSAIQNSQSLNFPDNLHQILPVVIFYIFGGQVLELFTVDVAQAKGDLLQA